jgi:ketosteroid isomerase-like protein
MKTTIAALALAGTLGACTQVSAGERDADAALADRIAIEDMVTRYYENFGRTDAAEDFGSFYTEDAVFDVNGIVSTGPKEISAFYAESAQDANAPARQGTFHMLIGNPVIDVNGDTATAKFTWTGFINREIGAPPELLEQGREYDRLVKHDGKWLIAKRVVIADSGLPDRYKATYTPRRDYDISKD